MFVLVWHLRYSNSVRVNTQHGLHSHRVANSMYAWFICRKSCFLWQTNIRAEKQTMYMFLTAFNTRESNRCWHSMSFWQLEWSLSLSCYGNMGGVPLFLKKVLRFVTVNFCPCELGKKSLYMWTNLANKSDSDLKVLNSSFHCVFTTQTLQLTY